MAISKEEKLRKVHQEAITEFARVQGALRDERLQCLQDRRFYSIAGAQWEGPLGEQFENKPRLEFNKVHLSVIRIINEYRNNRITVDFQTKDGTKDDSMADTCDGLYRADEKRSTADEAYDNAFEEGVGGGIGAWRLRAEYEDDEDEENQEQRIRIEPIFDADSSVFFNLDAKRYDKADATKCWVLSAQTRQAYIDEWGDDPVTWPKIIHQREFDWCTPDMVYLAEYYRVEEVSEMVFFYRSSLLANEQAEDIKVTQSDLDRDPEMLTELQATGFRKVREKRVTRRKVHKYIMSGGKILEDCGYIAGSCIPIVPFYGKRWFVDNVERCMGHVRLAKDAQRLTNSLMSWLATMAARFDMEKPILTPEQIAGHATMWAEDNVTQYPYLLINPITNENGERVATGPVGYTKAPNLPPAMGALMQIAEQALQDLMGNQQAGEQMQPNISGKVVELIQNRLDMQVFIYMSNFAKSMKRSGEIWLSMAKELLVEPGRSMKVIQNNDEAGNVVLNKPAYDEDSGEEYLENDITRATFEVDVEVGPSSSSRRASTVRALTGLASITDDPETKQALILASIANVEGEGLTDLRDWARASAVRKGIVKPTDDEKQQLAQEAASQAPDPQSVYLQAAAENQAADARKKQAETVETMASASLKQAQTRKTLADTLGAHVAQQLSIADAMRQAATPPPGVMPS